MPFFSSFKNTFFLWVIFFSACGNQAKQVVADRQIENSPDSLHTVVGANRTNIYLPLIADLDIGVVANQTSVVFKEGPDTPNAQSGYTHLVDSLVALEVSIKTVFAPEHGFRGTADAGEHVKDGLDTKTGLPIVSLYGKNRKPTQDQLTGLDLVIFDIQDVGVRFYTYIATLQLVMEACAENNIPILVLDRPNPNGHYVDGPSMEPEHTSFLGMNTIPLVYGMTLGEYAQMINEEGWLAEGVKAKLTVVPLENYTHSTPYSIPIRPSPNLPNDVAINLYPSLGLFEGTNVNAGRGTDFQFQRYGASFLDSTVYRFHYTPQPNFGSKYPKEEGKICYGEDLSKTSRMNHMSMKWLLRAYRNCPDQSRFFNTAGFTKHAGTGALERQITSGKTEAQIKASWEPAISNFKKVRAKYLLYNSEF